MMRRPAIFGGNWNDGDWAGSRYANVTNWPDNSNEWLGARGRSDDRLSARCWPRPRRPHTPCRFGIGGQPAFPASANTLHGPAERGVAGRKSCRDPRPAFFFEPFTIKRQMAKRYRNLIGPITADSNMREALRLTARGKRLTPGYLEFKEFGPLNLEELARDMREGTYVPGEAHEFRIHDPKPRIISALPFRDRVAQQAACLVIAPLFDKALLPRCYASRTGMGTHAGVRDVQATIRRLGRHGETVYALKTDFSRYFASIERATLWRLIERKISCRATLRLLEAMVPREGIGLPIGALTSQIFANLYTGLTLDRFLQQTLREPDWFRYMDDLVVLGTNPQHLRAVKDAIEHYSADELGLRFSKWAVFPVSRGINFLGYRIWPTHKLLRRQSVIRARRKIAAYRKAGDDERLQKFLAAWLGHASHADTRNLIKALGVGE
jgi:hypothetical protein